MFTRIIQILALFCCMHFSSSLLASSAIKYDRWFHSDGEKIVMRIDLKPHGQKPVMLKIFDPNMKMDVKPVGSRSMPLISYNFEFAALVDSGLLIRKVLAWESTEGVESCDDETLTPFGFKKTELKCKDGILHLVLISDSLEYSNLWIPIGRATEETAEHVSGSYLGQGFGKVIALVGS